MYDVTRHVRAPVLLDDEVPRQSDGRYLPRLPALEKREPDPNFTQRCEICGYRRGLHRWRSEECPNPLWRAGNGQQQFIMRTFRRKA